MTNLEQLVPPFELCQQIPKDAFNDTALVWVVSKNLYVRKRFVPLDLDRECNPFVFPAPTAQEILEAMNGAKAFETGVQMRDGGCFCYRCRISANNEEEFSTTGERLPEALLKLWLDVRRVEREAKNAKHEAT